MEITGGVTSGRTFKSTIAVLVTPKPVAVTVILYKPAGTKLAA